MHHPTILLTGFEPFGSNDRNPAGEIVQVLDGTKVAGFGIEGAVLSVSADGVGDDLFAAIERTQPDVVLSLGLAGGRTGLSAERVAINVLDFDIPDNAGVHLTDQPIVPGGPGACFATIPIRRISDAWTEAGIPGAVSNTAGTYICNQVLYLALHAAPRHGYRAGFIHLPYLPAQVVGEKSDRPSMAMDLMLRGITMAIEACQTPVAA
ncbi:MAG: pyroglutamyl-peptidase I [Chloroflexota bacterium]|nr:pyroglutamyl-peptidase I [Chloroflexota bacterium]